jgi:hypothetical protein
MFRSIQRLVPIAAIGLVMLLGGCVFYPEGGYRHGGYGPGWGWHGGGWHEGWRR